VRFFGLQDLVEKARLSLDGNGPVQFAAGSEAFLQMAVASLAVDAAKRGAGIVLVLPENQDVTRFASQLDSIAGELKQSGVRCGVMPVVVGWGNDRHVSQTLASRRRLYAQSLLRQGRSIVLTTLQGLLQSTLSTHDSSGPRIEKGNSYDQDHLLTQLGDLGYIKVSSVQDAGYYSIRGSILDVYAPQYEEPIRFEFAGDQIESIRFFSPNDQRSGQELSEALIGPANEYLLPAAKKSALIQRFYEQLIQLETAREDRDGMVGSLLAGSKFKGIELFSSLLREESTESLAHVAHGSLVLFPKSIAAAKQAYDDFLAEIESSHAKDIAAKKASVPPESHFPRELDIAKTWRGVVEFGNPHAAAGERFFVNANPNNPAGFPIGTGGDSASMDRWLDLIVKLVRHGEAAVVLLAANDDRSAKVRGLLGMRDLVPSDARIPLVELFGGQVPKPGFYVGVGDLESFVWLEDQRTLVLPDHTIFGRPPRKRQAPSVHLQNLLSSFRDLTVGDLVVHVQHGVGRYTGMRTVSVADSVSDFIAVEYAGGDKVYLPVDKLNVLQRYSGGSQDVALDKLGALTWEKRQKAVKGAVRDMAAELLRIHARRQVTGGHQYPPNSPEYVRFEENFQYVETDDQLRAIQDVEEDMLSGKLMDRLICGDVGFGKTEVALRATMRTVLEGYQVVVLVPTTVLCFQHYQTFRSRLEPFGVQVAQLNRFVKAKDSKDTLAKFLAGRIDVIIGTHRILSQDFKPRNLGLLVIDEEQRFGVTHKERLKRIRARANVLTLTATPIPRTLHMAMIGLRDISIVATPPLDRLSIKTYISRFDQDLIRDAIAAEIQRGGQVFFVHNRVQDINEVGVFLQSLVPGLRVGIGHGQMHESKLEAVIIDFLNGKFDVLLCTTIIESGIDMPNVNTLIVNHADRFGLGQLYQLRGRVGRSNKQAYAYFMTPPEEQLSDEARNRLEVLATHQELGAGFHVASYDLEFRGSGNLLGAEQSGHVAAVGLELYTQMLDDAIQELKGNPVEERLDAELKIKSSGSLPETYIDSERLRLSFYKAMFSVESSDQLDDLQKELRDRFGAWPREVEILLDIAKLKFYCRMCRISQLTELSPTTFEAKFAPLAAEQIVALEAAVGQSNGVLRLTKDFRLVVDLSHSTLRQVGGIKGVAMILAGLDLKTKSH
jgi:transcription-repair coupling factor (superfamily II helicase)